MTTDNSLLSPAGQVAGDVAAEDIAAPPQPAPINNPEPAPKQITPDDVADFGQFYAKQRGIQLGATLRQAQDTNPDQAAKASQLAGQTGLPLPTVMRNMADVEKQNAVTPDMVDSLIKNNPKVATWLQNPNNAALAHDDIPSLTGLDSAAKASPSLASDLWTGIKSTDFKLVGALDKAAVALSDAMPEGTPGKMTPEDRTAYLNRGQALQADASTADAPQLWSGQVAAGLTYAPFVGAAPLVVAGSEGLARVQQLEEQGVNASTAQQAGSIEGAMQGLIQMLPLGHFVLDQGLAPLLKSVIGSTAKAGAAGAGQSAIGDILQEKVLDKAGYTQLAEQAAPSIEKAAESALFFMGLHGGVQAVHSSFHAAVMKGVDGLVKADQALGTSTILQNISTLAGQNKLRERSPEAFNSFMQSATADTAINTLWLEPEAMKQAGITPEALSHALPQHAAAIADAVKDGYAVKIPAADFATALADTDIGKALIPHMKTDPNGMSQTEAEDFMKSGGAEKFKAEMDNAQTTAESTIAFERSAKEVEKQIAARYAATGRFPADVNNTVARLGSFYRVIAGEYGISPEEAYARHGASITGTDMLPGTEAFGKGEKPEKSAPATAIQPVAELPQVAAAAGPEVKITTPAPVAPKSERAGLDIEHAITAIRSTAPKTDAEQHPLINFIKAKGGIREGGPLHNDLRDELPAIKDKAIDLVRKDGRFAEADAIPAKDIQQATGLEPEIGHNDYASPQWVRDQIKREILGQHLPEVSDDPNVENVKAEIQRLGLNFKEIGDIGVKQAILKSRAEDAKAEAKSIGFTLSDEQAHEVAKLRAAGYDIMDSTDSVLERNDLKVIYDIGQQHGFEPADIPFEHLAIPGHEPGTEGGGNPSRAGDVAERGGAGAAGKPQEGNLEPAGPAGAAHGETSQKGVSDTELFDAEGRAVDKKDNFFQSAFHGSPYKFDKFTLDHIGKGEGNQAYGWGLYFAGNREVAEYYKKTLEHQGRITPEVRGALKEMDNLGFSNAAEAISNIRDEVKNGKDWKQVWDAARPEDAARAKIIDDYLSADKSGQVYEVHIPENDELLDWDKPIGEQPAKVRQAMESLAVKHKDKTRLSDMLQSFELGNTSGASFYHALSAILAPPEDKPSWTKAYKGDEGDRAASQELNALGIKGLRYLDGPSRVKGEGHHNYVIFDDSAVQTLKTFYQGGKSGDQNNAAYNPTTREIWLGKKANLTSILHEEGHHFLNVYTKLAAEEGAPARIREVADAALKSLGIEGATPEERLANWHGKSIDEQRGSHEQWARSFERYLFRGKAPSLESQPAFDAFRGWMKHIYVSIKNFVAQNPEAGKLNEEMRSVMDRMLATDQEIEYARQVRNFSTLFRTPEEGKAIGMTPDEYRAYQGLGAQSTVDAIGELQGRSLRDLALTRHLREDAVREYKGEARAKRKAVSDEIAQQVQSEPVNRARTFLKKGEIDGNATGGNHRLDIDALKQMYGEGENSLWRQLESKFGKYGIIGKGGLHPDDIGRMFGYDTGDDLVKALVEESPPAEKVASLTDQTMIERYGDLTDPRTIARRADQAVHNEARIRSVGTELNAVRRALGQHKILHDAAKDYANDLVSRLKVKDVSPDVYATAAAKAQKMADIALKKGDLAGVAEAKRNQLVNEYATKAAYDALDTIRKIQTNARRYEKAPVRKRIGTDIEQIDALLDQYDMRKNQVERVDKRQQSLKDWYDSQIAADYEPMIDPGILTNQAKTHYVDLPLSSLRGLDAALRTIEATAKARKEITVEGKKVALNEAVSEMVARMSERKEKFSPEELLNRPRKGVDSFYAVALNRFSAALRSGIGSLKPQDFRANMYDLHEIEGPFHRFIFNKLFDRNYWKNAQLSEISKAFEEKVKELGPEWRKSLYDKIPNDVLIDKPLNRGALENDPNNPDYQTSEHATYRQLTRGDLIGIARHVGNESNFAKLTEGMGWKGEDVWRFLDQHMRESDWKAVQAEWDAFEKHWPEIEAMIRRLGGEVPEKIALRPFKTRFAEMKGGYAPIEYDPLRSRLAQRLGDVHADPSQSIGRQEYYKATTTMNSSLKNRVEGYSDIVNLDYHYMTRRLHETVHDLAYREAILDAKKIIEHPEFRQQFHQTFGPEEYGNLQKFLQNTRDMYKRDYGMDGFEKMIQYSRQGIVMNGVGYRLSTVIKHGSSAALKSAGFVEGPGRKYLLARAARMATGNASADIAEAREKFPEINARLQRMDRDFSAGEHSLYDNETWRDKNNRMGHAMIAWSDALTAIPTAHAAYDWAITEGIPKKLGGSGKPMTHAAAVQFANGIVRQAHGGTMETARSNFLHEKGMSSLLGMIYQFQNNTFGQLSDIKDKFGAEASRYQSNPALAGRLMASLVAPAVAAYLVGHGWDDEPWYKQLAQAITGELASTVPLLRDGWNMVEALSEGRDWKDAGLMLPPVRLAGDIAVAVKDAVKEAQGHSTQIIKDSGNAIGEAFHIAGLGQAGKTLQYVRDVKQGKQHPANIRQMITGATIGPPLKNQGAAPNVNKGTF